jgi:serine/threonine protein kinase
MSCKFNALLQNLTEFKPYFSLEKEEEIIQNLLSNTQNSISIDTSALVNDDNVVSDNETVMSAMNSANLIHLLEKNENIGMFRTIESNITSMFITSINNSGNFMLKPEFINENIDMFFPFQWTIGCFNKYENENIYDLVSTILYKCVMRANDKIFINVCSLLPFAMLSFLTSPITHFSKKFMEDNYKNELAKLSDNNNSTNSNNAIWLLNEPNAKMLFNDILNTTNTGKANVNAKQKTNSSLDNVNSSLDNVNSSLDNVNNSLNNVNSSLDNVNSSLNNVNNSFGDKYESNENINTRKNVSLSPLSGGKMLGKGGFGSVWHVESDKDIIQILGLPSNSHIESFGIYSNVPSILNEQEFLDKTICKFFKNNQQEKFERNTLISLYEILKSDPAVNNYTLFFINEQSGDLVVSGELDAQYIKSKGMVGISDPDLEDEIRVLKDKIESITKRLIMYRNKIEDRKILEDKQTELEGKLRVLLKQQKQQQKQKQKQKQKKVKRKEQVKQIQEIVYHKRRSFIPYLRCNGDVSGERSLSFIDIKNMLISVGTFLDMLHRRGLYHLDIKPPNIFYKNGKHSQDSQEFFLGDYGSINKKITLFTVSYASPYVFWKACSDEIEEYINTLTQIFVYCLNNIQPMKDKNMRSMKIKKLLETCVSKKSQRDFFINYIGTKNLAKSDMYSLGLSLLVIISFSTKLTSKEFNTLFNICKNLILYNVIDINPTINSAAQLLETVKAL